MGRHKGILTGTNKGYDTANNFKAVHGSTSPGLVPSYRTGGLVQLREKPINMLHGVYIWTTVPAWMSRHFVPSTHGTCNIPFAGWLASVMNMFLV